jgi:hypothetical protein
VLEAGMRMGQGLHGLVGRAEKHGAADLIDHGVGRQFQAQLL